MIPNNSSAGKGALQRTIILYVLLAVMSYVGVSITQLQKSSGDQEKAQAVMQTKFDDLQTTLKPVTDALPTLEREVDKLDLQSADHDRRITALEQLKGLKR